MPSQSTGDYPAPSQATFSGSFCGLGIECVNQTVLAIQEQLRGPAPITKLIVLDSKELKHSSGVSVRTAVTVPSQHHLASAVVDTKTKETPVAQRELIPLLDLQGRLVSLDALHTQAETPRVIVLEAGGTFFPPVSTTSPLCGQTLKPRVPPPGGFPPSRA